MVGNFDINNAPEYQGDERLTPDEEAELLDYMAGGNYPRMQEGNNVIAFFNKIFRAKNTTKGGNITKEELVGLRTLLTTADYCEVMDLDKVGLFVRQYAENHLSLSLSKDATLLNAVITSKKQLSTESKSSWDGGKKKSWLSRKEQA